MLLALLGFRPARAPLLLLAASTACRFANSVAKLSRVVREVAVALEESESCWLDERCCSTDGPSCLDNGDGGPRAC